jgi:hypothetical protein
MHTHVRQFLCDLIVPWPTPQEPSTQHHRPTPAISNAYDPKYMHTFRRRRLPLTPNVPTYRPLSPAQSPGLGSSLWRHLLARVLPTSSVSPASELLACICSRPSSPLPPPSPPSPSSLESACCGGAAPPSTHSSAVAHSSASMRSRCKGTQSVHAWVGG